MQLLNRHIFASRDRRIPLNGETFVSRPDTNGVPHQINDAVEIGRPQSSDIFVSCLMVTRNRFRQAQVAVECFLRQTFEQRELVVLDGSEEVSFRDWLAHLNDPRIRYVDVRGESA